MISIPGFPPSLIDPPPGCRFAPRCPFAVEICRERDPELAEVGPNHFSACHRAADVELIRDRAKLESTWLERNVA